MVRFLEPSEYEKTRALFVRCFQDEAFAEEYYDGGPVRKNRIVVKETDGRIVSMAHLIPRFAWYRQADTGLWGRAEKENDAAGDGAVENARGMWTKGELHAVSVDYLAMVATDPAYRHRGYMDEVLRFAIAAMQREGKPWTFLIAVDQAIYRHLGFVYDWPFSPEEAELLYADDGLTECSARLLCATRFQRPERITEEADSLLLNKSACDSI